MQFVRMAGKSDSIDIGGLNQENDNIECWLRWY